MSEFIEWVKNIPDNFKQFIIDNQRNPIMWIAFFFIGLALFFLTYRALHKKNSI